MSTTEIPAGNSEGDDDGFANNKTTTTDQSAEPEPVAPAAPANSEKAAEAEGIKSTICQRVLIGGLLLIAVAIAVIGTVIAVVPELKKESANNPITEDPFQVDLPLFSANITEPYVSIEEARNDIEQLAKSIANSIILDEANRKNDYGCHMHFAGFNGDLLMSSGGQPMNEQAVFKSSGAAPMSASDSSEGDYDGNFEGESGSASAFEGADDFETYQHETGVLKSDLVKSNGVHVFATVGDDRILVWGLEGTLFETITMPSLKNHYGYSLKPCIHALLMNPQGTKLTAVVSGYGEEYETINYNKNDNMTRPIVHHYLGTRVIVFGIEGSTLTELSQTDINGYHVDSYMVGSNVHIVTKMGLNTLDYLSDPLRRWKTFQDMTNDEYVAAATLKAEEIMPEFVNKVVDIVTVEGKIVLSRLAVFADSISESSDDTNIDDLFGCNVATTTITQVNSFDTGTIGSEDDMTLNISKSLVLQPGNTEYVYVTDEWIWVADQGWAWNVEEGKYAEQTMLLGFRLDGSSSTLAAVGSVPGSLLSQFSIDFVRDKNDNAKEYVRIATTQNFFQNGWWDSQPSDESSSRTMNQIVIFEVPKAEGDNDPNSNALVRLGSVELGKKDEIITAVRFFDNFSYVVTFERTDPFYVLDLSDPMDPKVLGELEIPGFSQFMHPIKEDNSMLIAVGQDADENGRISGFQISIFDSTIPTDPKLIDRLAIVEDDKDSWSGSSASWDERAFRYIQVGDDGNGDLGRLIIPVDVYASWDNFGNKVGEDFEGFMVFGVDLTKTENLITREVEIDHSSQQNDDDATMFAGTIAKCYCGHTWLPERSMVFDGNLMTLKNQEVISTNLVTHETQWNLAIKDDDNCCYEYP